MKAPPTISQPNRISASRSGLAPALRMAATCVTRPSAAIAIASSAVSSSLVTAATETGSHCSELNSTTATKPKAKQHHRGHRDRYLFGARLDHRLSRPHRSGTAPALVALASYGLLPILQAAISGLDALPAEARDAATGLGMSPTQMLARVELPLAWPVIVAGIRSSVLINIGTAAIASTVGVKSLGSPIIIGLAGFNTAYVIQGALLVGLLAVVVDLAFERWSLRARG